MTTMCQLSFCLLLLLTVSTPTYLPHLPCYGKKNPAKSLLRGKTWLCSADDVRRGRCEVVFLLSETCHLSNIDIGNHGSFTVEVQACCSGSEFTTLVPATTFMTPTECRNATNRTAVKMFNSTHFTTTSGSGQMCDKLRLICTQPHRRDKPFGIAMVRLLSDTDDASHADGEPGGVDEETKALSPRMSQIMNHFYNQRSSLKQDWFKGALQDRLERITSSGRKSQNQNRNMNMVMAAIKSPTHKSPLAQSLMNGATTLARNQPTFLTLVKNFFKTLDLSKIDPYNTKVSELRHQFEKLKCRKLSSEEKKIFKAYSLEYFASRVEAPDSPSANAVEDRTPVRKPKPPSTQTLQLAKQLSAVLTQSVLKSEQTSAPSPTPSPVSVTDSPSATIFGSPQSAGAIRSPPVANNTNRLSDRYSSPQSVKPTAVSSNISETPKRIRSNIPQSVTSSRCQTPAKNLISPSVCTTPQQKLETKAPRAPSQVSWSPDLSASSPAIIPVSTETGIKPSTPKVFSSTSSKSLATNPNQCDISAESRAQSRTQKPVQSTPNTLATKTIARFAPSAQVLVDGHNVRVRKPPTTLSHSFASAEKSAISGSQLVSPSMLQANKATPVVNNISKTAAANGSVILVTGESASHQLSTTKIPVATQPRIVATSTGQRYPTTQTILKSTSKSSSIPVTITVYTISPATTTLTTGTPLAPTASTPVSVYSIPVSPAKVGTIVSMPLSGMKPTVSKPVPVSATKSQTCKPYDSATPLQEVNKSLPRSISKPTLRAQSTPATPAARSLVTPAIWSPATSTVRSVVRAKAPLSSLKLIPASQRHRLHPTTPITLSPSLGTPSIQSSSLITASTKYVTSVTQLRPTATPANHIACVSQPKSASNPARPSNIRKRTTTAHSQSLTESQSPRLEVKPPSVTSKRLLSDLLSDDDDDLMLPVSKQANLGNSGSTPALTSAPRNKSICLRDLLSSDDEELVINKPKIPTRTTATTTRKLSTPSINTATTSTNNAKATASNRSPLTSSITSKDRSDVTGTASSGTTSNSNASIATTHNSTAIAAGTVANSDGEESLPDILVDSYQEACLLQLSKDYADEMAGEFCQLAEPYGAASEYAGDYSDFSCSEQRSAYDDHPTKSAPVSLVQCPICMDDFPAEVIELHASNCIIE